jgi:ABC-type transporter Mla subunit MlaD
MDGAPLCLRNHLTTWENDLLRVGRVSAVKLADHEAEIEMSLRPGLDLHKDAQVSTRTRGLVGEKFITLEPGSPSTLPLPPGATITQTESRVSIDEMLAKIPPLMDELRPIITDVQSVAHSLHLAIGTKEGAASLKDILANLDRTSQNLHSLTSGVGTRKRYSGQTYERRRALSRC